MPRTNREQYERIKAIFDEICDRPWEQRDAYLDSHCGDDPDLRTDVEGLLAQYDTPMIDFDAEGVRMADMISEVASQSAASLAAAPPTHIGPYRIVRLLGEGGMGVVYLAEQDRPKRTVALKVIRPGFTTPALMRRFEHEAHILGRLQHPGIAQIFAASTADTGYGAQPYLVMEYIDGLPILAYARSHNLSTQDRLALFIRICDAVEHAHQKGVIHRDLKPANILVGADGHPKVLDFGVSRATDPEVQMTTIAGGGGQIIGTLPYMSPEQTSGESNDVDTRSDVYSLGVILFEVLSGQLPYDLTGASVPEMTRVIRDQEPLRLGAISRAWRGDLETIVTKALEKDKARRYQTVREMAQDIDRHLNDVPIIARPASTVYHLRKFARRNRAVVVGAAAVFVVLIAATMISSMLLVRALRAEQTASLRLNEATEARRAVEAALEREHDERTEAERQQRIAELVTTFFTDDLLAQADPEQQPDRELSLREVLDRASQRIEGRFVDLPLVEAQIRLTIGRTYRGLGHYDAAEEHFQRLLDLRRQQLGEFAEQTLVAMIEIAYLLGKQGRYEESAELYRETLALQREHLGDEHPHTLTTMNNLAGSYINQSRFADAEPLMRDVVAARRRVLGTEHWRTAASINNLGALHIGMGHYDEAEELFLEALDIRERLRGPEHFETLQTVNNLAALYSQTDRLADAIELFEHVVEVKRRTFGEDHPETLFSKCNLGARYAQDEQFDDAEQLLHDVLTTSRATLGDAHPTTLLAGQRLAAVFGNTQRCEDAEALLADVIVLYDASQMSRHTYKGAALRERGECLTQLDRFEEAEQCLRESLDIFSTVLGEAHEQTQQTAHALARLEERWHERR